MTNNTLLNRIAKLVLKKLSALGDPPHSKIKVILLSWIY